MVEALYFLKPARAGLILPAGFSYPRNMRLVVLLGACFLVAGQDAPPAPTVKPEDKCSMEGAVLNAATGEALKKANVVARQMNSRNNSAFTAVSDAAGHFKIEGIDPGSYNVMASRTGYVTQMYGAKAPNRPGALVTLTAGQSMKDVTFKLTPHGVITGRVMDEDGDPVANV